MQTGAAPSCRGLISRLAYARANREGIDADDLVKKAGLVVADINIKDARLSVAGQIKFLELVADAIADPELGFHLAQDYELRNLDFLYYVAASADTLGNALLRLERYSRLVNDGVLMRVRKGKFVRISFEYTGIARHTDRHQMEFWVTSGIRICRQLTGRHLIPVHARIAHHRAYATSDLATFAGIGIEAGADVDEIAFPAASWDYPVVTTDRHLHEFLVQYCEDALARRQIKVSPLRVQVENAAAELLPHGQAHSELVAARLGMSARTLARRLAAEGVSFADILRELRSALAHRYLADREMPISQVAWLLGYTEIGAFTHAFRRWTGVPPSAARGQPAVHVGN